MDQKLIDRIDDNEKLTDNEQKLRDTLDRVWTKRFMPVGVDKDLLAIIPLLEKIVKENDKKKTN